MSTSTQRTVMELRQICTKNDLVMRAELAKNGLPAHQEGNERTDYMARRSDLRRLINSLTDTIVPLCDKAGSWTEAEKAEHERINNLLEAFCAEIELINHYLEMSAIVEAGQPGGGKPANWKGRGGGEIRVLGRNDRLANDVFRGENFGFGEYVVAMVTGTQRPEVRDALTEGTDSAGGYTVPAYLMHQLIDAMRAKTVAVKAGALTVPLETEKTTIARLETDPQAGWRLERAGVAVTDPTFGAVTFTARSLACLVRISRELLEDSINIDSALMLAFAGAMASEVDRVALFGSGAAPEPLGLFSTPGVSQVSMGDDGAALAGYGKMLDALYELENANANAPSAWVMAPRTSRVLNGLTDTTGQPLNPPKAIQDVPRFVSTMVPTDQTQGTADNASPIIVGDFSQMLIGVRTNLRIEVLRETFAETLEYAFLAHLRADIAIAQPKAFAVVKGVIPA